jgi:hypothetical protein
MSSFGRKRLTRSNTGQRIKTLIPNKMKILYFKNVRKLHEFANNLKKQGEMVTMPDYVSCDCGCSAGYYTDTYKLIFCRRCYDRADRTEQGE